MLFIDEMPYSPSDCKYASEMYTYINHIHYRCNYDKTKIVRPLCDLREGDLKLLTCFVEREINKND
jgi:hypothetical protein